MKLICESCQTRYSISDEKVRGKNKVFKIKCRSCGETIVVKGQDPDAPAAESEDDATTVAPAPSGMEPDEALDDGWYVVLAGEQVGPLAKAAVLQHLAQGALDATSFVWRQGYDDWKKLSEVEGLSHLVASPPAVASAEDDATMMDDQLPDNVRALFEADRASRASKAAVPDSSDGPTMALGPGDDELAMTRMVPTGELESESASRAEAHHPVAQPAQPAEAQPLRTSTGQMKARSLESFFGEEEPAAPQEEPGGFFGQEPKAADSGPMLYQRRETSVLFSLNEFKKDKTKDAPMAGLGADTKSQDSGLIDVRAVARKETKARQARQTAGDLFADFGGGAAETEAPVEMSTRLDTAAAAPLLQKKPSRAPVWIGLAAVLVIGGAVGVYLYLNQEKPAAPASQAQAQAPVEQAPAGTQEPVADPKAAGDPKQAEPVADPKQAEQAAQPEPEKAPEVAAAADAGAHEEAASADAGSASGAGEEVAKAEGTGDQGAVDPGEKQPEKTPAEKAAAEKAAKELAAKKAAEAKKKAEEKAMAMKETPKAPVEQPKKEEKKVAVVAQNTQGNSATDLLNMVQTQQKKETPPTPPVAGGEGDGAQTKLSASVVRKVIREHQGKVVGCYRTHGGGGAGAVTINTSITVGGDGGVRSARVTTGEYAGNAVGSCIVSALRGMSFPRFASDSQTISIPFRVQ